MATIKVIQDYICAPEAEQVATMRRANERRAAELAVIAAARELQNAILVLFLMPKLGGGNVRELLHEMHNLQRALLSLDAAPPVWQDDTRPVQR